MLGLRRSAITDLTAASDAIRRGRYGMIEVCAGQLEAIHLRRLPKFVSIFDVVVLAKLYHQHRSGNRCWVYYNQPRRFPNFLAVTLVLSTRDCTLASLRAAMETLDRVAEIKRADALLCDVWNFRISTRLLERAHWQPHKPSRWHRHYIKRFYGVYPEQHSASASSDAAAIGAVRSLHGERGLPLLT